MVVRCINECVWVNVLVRNDYLDNANISTNISISTNSGISTNISISISTNTKDLIGDLKWI